MIKSIQSSEDTSDPLSFFVFEKGPAVVKPAENIRNLNPRDAFIKAAKLAVPILIGGIMIWLGLTTTGSYFESASRFKGVLADVFYTWQIGTFIAMIGCILIYDAIRRSGYL